MKKCILPILAVAAIVVLAVFNMNINLQKNSMSDVALTNVEALATGEGIFTKDCYLGIDVGYTTYWIRYTNCFSCGTAYGTNIWDPNHCYIF
jgi:hypothetical protein